MDFLKQMLAKQKKLHFTLIDPENQTPQEAGQRAALCKSYGTDAIMIGGSTVPNREIVYETVSEIKTLSGLPTILFPNSSTAVSPNADYVFFMMLMNSMDRRFLLGEQIKAAKFIRDNRIKTISMAYIVASMSSSPTTVEKAAGLDRITAADIEKAVDYALTAKFLNMECIYLEAGSGAEKPITNEMIKAVKNASDLPIIVGGGIRDGKTAREKTESGADIIVNGSLSERDSGKIKEIISSIKK
jgi:phosphoglycerol geranylgeranyltransferase